MVAKILVDANILYSRTLRDWLLQLSLDAGMFRCYGTEHVYAEAAYHLQRNHPDRDGAVFSSFRRHYDDCLIRIDSYPALDDYPGNDPNDKHLHSAAIAGEIDKIVTTDKLFAAAAAPRDDLPYEVWLADEFLVLVDDSEELLVRYVTKKYVDYQLKRDGECHLVEQLRDAGCPEFAERVRKHLQRIL